jgi:hypothetical protein
MVQRGYAGGVPMGGELETTPGSGPPGFLVNALRDPLEAPLERVQIIKGWFEDGSAREKVFDIACGDGQAPDPTTHRCAFAGTGPDLQDCSIDASQGRSQISTWWTDPEFEAAQRGFYYVRVLQIPTCRWSTYDAIRLGVPRPTDVPATIQERAISSPIWVAPAS